MASAGRFCPLGPLFWPCRLRPSAQQPHGTLRIQTGTSIDSDGDRVTERFEIAGVPDVSRLEGLLLEQRAGAR